MKLTRKETVEYEVVGLHLEAGLRHAEEDCPEGVYGLSGETLRWPIDLTTTPPRIIGWIGPAIELHSKVCDCCSIRILSADGKCVAEQENDYVPDFFPGNHYGDYLILNVDQQGRITNWDATPADIQEWIDSLDSDA